MRLTNKSLCASCGGDCCKRLPGCCLPEDIERLFPAESLFMSVKMALASGNFQIACWDASQALYYVRQTVLDGNQDRVLSYSWGGKCKLHTSKGCKLKFKDRPFECRILVPSKDRYCVYQKGVKSGKYESGKAWHKIKGWRKFVNTISSDRKDLKKELR